MINFWKKAAELGDSRAIKQFDGDGVEFLKELSTHEIETMIADLRVYLKTTAIFQYQYMYKCQEDLLTQDAHKDHDPRSFKAGFDAGLLFPGRLLEWLQWENKRRKDGSDEDE